MLPHWGMVIDLCKCIGCEYCVYACQATNDVADDMRWNIHLVDQTPTGETFHITRPCLHCQNAPCVHVCPVGATYYRPDGLVAMDYAKCIGCRYCQAACPYGARTFNWRDRGDEPNTKAPEWGTPEVDRRPRGVVEKCTFCVHRLDAGLARGLTPRRGIGTRPPACVIRLPGQRPPLRRPQRSRQPVSRIIASTPTLRLRRGPGSERACTTSRRKDWPYERDHPFRPALCRSTACGSGLLAAMFGIGVDLDPDRARQGLEITDLSNQLPWGLWITVDLSSIALGAGAFTLSAAVYIFGMKKYEAIARAAVLIGLLGYTGAMMALFVDIGRPDRFYHPLIFWNVHSVLWEITLCVMVYTTVLVMEVVPIVIESTPLKNNRFLLGLAHFLHRIMPVAALLGMALSLLHQSSLGATYGVLTARPVWFSPSAPVLFILSAVAAGIGLTVGLTMFTGLIKRQELVPPDIIDSVAKFAGFANLAYLYLKIWSWAATNYYSHSPAVARDLELLGEHTPYGFTFWWFEILLGALVPAVLFLWPRTRRNRWALMLAAVLGVVGVIVYRWNMTLAGLVVPMDWSPGVADVFSVASYTPSVIEWGVAIGVLGYWLLIWSLAARFLHLYPQARPFGSAEAEAAEAPADAHGAESPAAAR